MLGAFTSFIENYKGKIRNPFFGTLISVWIVRNWIVLYAVFTFDKEYTMADKIAFIQSYFAKQIFWAQWLNNILIVFGILLLTYILFGFSRFLTDGYYKIVEKKIVNFLDKNAVFTKIDKTNLDKAIVNLNESIEKLRNTNDKLEIRNTLLETRSEEQLQSSARVVEDLEIKNSALQDELNCESAQKLLAENVSEYFNNIIEKMPKDIEKEFEAFIDNQNSKNSKKTVYKNYVGLKNFFLTMGIMYDDGPNSSETILGILFIEYYKEYKLKIESNFLRGHNPVQKHEW